MKGDEHDEPAIPKDLLLSHKTDLCNFKNIQGRKYIRWNSANSMDATECDASQPHSQFGNNFRPAVVQLCHTRDCRLPAYLYKL